MAIETGSLIEVVVSGSHGGQVLANVWQFLMFSTPGGITAAQYGEALWNHWKVKYRSIPAAVFDNMFESVSVRELDSLTGDYGVYSVPASERGGTGGNGSSPSPLPLFSAVGVRMSVGTRVTRPGQKRFAGMTESDNDNGKVQERAVLAVEDLLGLVVANMTLGAPALTATLSPVIVRKDIQGLPTAYQDVIGFSVNPYMTSQVSRKVTR